MNITIIHGSNDTYGASRVLLHEVRCLVNFGHHVHIVVPSIGPLHEQVQRFGPQVEISVDSNLLILRRSRILDSFRRPRLPGPARHADLVILWTLATAAYIPILSIMKKRFYVSVHELLEDWKAKIVFSVLLRGSFPLTACSHATRKWLNSVGVRNSRVTVTYPIVDVQIAEGQKSLQEGVYSDKYTVVVYGRINGHKGHLEVCKAFQEPIMRDESWRLVLAGAPFPGQESALDDVLRIADEDARISYLGELRSLSEIKSEIDIVAVFPSKAEPFGLVPIEAWSHGIRSIGYGDGGAAEVLPLVGGTCVHRVDDDEPGAIAAALVAARGAKRDAAALPTYETVSGVFTCDERSARLQKVLEMALAAGPKGFKAHSDLEPTGGIHE